MQLFILHPKPSPTTTPRIDRPDRWARRFPGRSEVVPPDSGHSSASPEPMASHGTMVGPFATQQADG